MKKGSPLYVVLFMAALALFFGAAVAVVHYSTLGLLERNERLHRNRVLCRAFLVEPAGGGAEDYEAAVAGHIRPLDVSAGGRRFMAYEKAEGPDPAVGFVFVSQGFWDRITGILVLSPDLKRCVNVQFFEQSETPGLGARIEEKWFTDQFNGLVVGWEAPPDQRLIIGGRPDPALKNRVDGITGASQTTMALMKSLNGELELFRQAYAGGK